MKDLHHQQLADTVDKSLWVFSQKGKQLSVEQLSINLGRLLLKMQEFQLSMMEPLVLEYESCAEESDSDSRQVQSGRIANHRVTVTLALQMCHYQIQMKNRAILKMFSAILTLVIMSDMLDGLHDFLGQIYCTFFV